MFNSDSSNKASRRARAAWAAGGTGTGAALLLTSQAPAHAQATTPVDDMATQLGVVETAAAAITTIAISSIVFNIGAKIVKRFAHS